MASKSASVALNIGSQTVSAASFAGGSSGAVLLKSYDSREIQGDPTGDEVRGPQTKLAISDLISGLKLKGQNVRYAVPAAPVFTRFVKLPPLAEDKVGQIVEFEAQQNVPFPINEVDWGYQLIAGEDDENEVLIGAIKSNELAEIDTAVQTSGLNTVSVDVAPMLIYNAFRYNYPDETDPVLIVDIGSRTTNLIYAEGDRVFVSTSRIGGATISAAIAKELDGSYEDGEQLKLASQVAAGGNVVDGDEQAQAVANVVRTTLTRLHGEISRTNNRYRTQQGGKPPTKILLAGRAAALPGIGDFFVEKFNLPVEYFNAVRNVALGPKVDADRVAAEAHAMGELVGLALRNKPGSPLELELVPAAVERSRDNEKRKPALLTALAVLLSGLAAAGFYFYQKGAKAREAVAEIEKKMEEPQRFYNSMSRATTDLKKVQAQTQPFINVLEQRSQWYDILRELNSRLPNKLVWTTGIEPMVRDDRGRLEVYASKKKEMGEKLGNYHIPDIPPTKVQPPAGAKPRSRSSGKKEEEIYQLAGVRLVGLFRDNPEGQSVVYSYLANLRQSSLFDLPEDLEDTKVVVLADDPGDESKWAWSYEMELPLKNPINVEVSDKRK